MDSAAISYLGYLPQDVLGFSIFDYYHMDDMPHLKDIYELGNLSTSYIVDFLLYLNRAKPFRARQWRILRG